MKGVRELKPLFSDLIKDIPRRSLDSNPCNCVYTQDTLVQYAIVNMCQIFCIIQQLFIETAPSLCYSLFRVQESQELLSSSSSFCFCFCFCFSVCFHQHLICINQPKREPNVPCPSRLRLSSKPRQEYPSIATSHRQ